MPLDLSQVVAQLGGLAARLKSEREERGERRGRALQALHDADPVSLKRKIAASDSPWPVAVLTDGLAQRCGAPACPPDFTVIAVDGSQIEVDRHSSVRCYLINIGSALLHYGGSTGASLEAEATIFFGDDLAFTNPVSGRVELIEGPLLGVKRSVDECQALADIVERLPAERPTLALADGSLILWGMSPKDYESYIREELLDRRYLGAFDRMKSHGDGQSFALASYISSPRSVEVTGALRLWLCPHNPIECDRCRGRECDAIAGVPDSDIFGGLLEYGERSAIFISGSRFMRDYYRDHQVHFFYLKVDDEIARVEIPQWVAEDEGRVELAHALALDQCRRGHGYPVALMEAHEKAVVTAADRKGFWELVETALQEERMDVKSSGKSRSKRGRWV